MKNLPYINTSHRHWMVIYTRSRWEKKVHQLLEDQGIEAFCPTVKRERQWADRKKIVEFPLFNSYIFVRINTKEEQTVRQTLGVINFVYHSGKPAIMRDTIIADIKNYLTIYQDIESISLTELKVGSKVQINKGVFLNQKGEIIRIEGKNILLVLEDLDCVLTTKIKIQDLSLVS